MSVLTPIEWVEEKELTPQPEIEFDVVMEASLEKFKRKVNLMLWQWWQTGGWMNAVAVWTGIRFYQSMVRRNVDGGLKPEMPSKNSEASAQGSQPLHIPGLEDEPDLYEDVEKDATNW